MLYFQLFPDFVRIYSMYVRTSKRWALLSVSARYMFSPSYTSPSNCTSAAKVTFAVGVWEHCLMVSVQSFPVACNPIPHGSHPFHTHTYGSNVHNHTLLPVILFLFGHTWS